MRRNVEWIDNHNPSMSAFWNGKEIPHWALKLCTLRKGRIIGEIKRFPCWSLVVVFLGKKILHHIPFYFVFHSWTNEVSMSTVPSTPHAHMKTPYDWDRRHGNVARSQALKVRVLGLGPTLMMVQQVPSLIISRPASFGLGLAYKKTPKKKKKFQ